MPVWSQDFFSPIFLGGARPRILLTAPSNAAVDEIARKLLTCRQKLKPEDRFRMMRIGQPNNIHPDVKCITVDELKEKNLEITHRSGKNEESLKQEIADLKHRIAEMTKKLERKDATPDELAYTTR